MNYFDGQKVKLGDSIRLWEGCHGIVMALIDEGEFAESYKKADWAYLEEGALIESDAAGLIHQTRPDDEWVLIGRSLVARHLVRPASKA